MFGACVYGWNYYAQCYAGVAVAAAPVVTKILELQQAVTRASVI